MRRHHRGARRKQPSQWVSSPQGYGASPTVITTAAVSRIELAGASGVAASFDPPVIQRYTVHAIKGEIIGFFQSASAGSIATLSAGICVATVSASSNAPLLDPFNQVDAGTSWMWLRHWIMTATVAGPFQQTSWNLYQNPDGPWVDVKTRRVMKENEQLILYVSARLPAVGDSFTVQPFLRTLIKRVA